jgi:hypothetical protein
MNPSMQANLSNGTAFPQGNRREFVGGAREESAKIEAKITRESARV